MKSLPQRFAQRGLPLVCMLFVTVALVQAVEPEIAEVYFDESFSGGYNKDQRFPGWIRAIEHDGGYFNVVEKFWAVPERTTEGEGWIAVHLDRSQLASNLAMALFVNEHETTDLAVQLFNASGEVVAVDLFANVAETMRVAETDYLIIPLRKYDDASTIVLRRIKGRVEVAGMVFFPVIGAVKNDPQVDVELLTLLGDTPSLEYKEYLKRRIQDEKSDPNSGRETGESKVVTTGAALLSADLPFVLLRSELKPPVDVYLIPMDFSPELALKVAEKLGEELDLHIAVSVQMGTSPEMYEPERGQYNATRILSEAQVVVRRISNQESTPYAIVLLHQDINRPPYNLRYTFAVHSTEGVSVISTARMDL